MSKAFGATSCKKRLCLNCQGQSVLIVSLDLRGHSHFCRKDKWRLLAVVEIRAERVLAHPEGKSSTVRKAAAAVKLEFSPSKIPGQYPPQAEVSYFPCSTNVGAVTLP